MECLPYLCVFLAISSLFSQPTDLTVIEGSATLTHTSSKHLSIDVSDRAILHWEDFSVGHHEKVQFILPSKEGAVLNRVVGPYKSVIHGQLTSNGQVILLNPKGILIGPQGEISVGGLIASTLDLSDVDFLKNEELLFQGLSPHGVVNYGTVRALFGVITLLGRYVENHGLIEGSTQIGAGEDILLKPEEGGHIFIRASKTAAKVQEELKGGKSPYRYAIEQAGEIDALTLCHEKGRVLLKTAGDVLVNGTLRGDSQIEGGRVEINGEIESPGGKIELVSKILTYIGKTGKVCVHGGERGNGGEIYLLSKGTVTLLGTVDVSGGALGGDGGLIELSGLYRLDPTGTINRFAPHGRPGLLVFSPITDVIIQNERDESIDLVGFNSPLSQDLTMVNIDTLLAEVQKGPLTLRAGQRDGGSGQGKIILSSTLNNTYDTPHPLLFHSEGAGGIVISGSLCNLGKGPLTFSSPYGNIEQTGQINTYGPLTLDTGRELIFSGTEKNEARLLTQEQAPIYLNALKGINLKSHTQISTCRGNLLIQTAGPLRLMEKTQIGNFGEGVLTIQGFEGKPIDSIHLYQGQIKTSLRSGLLSIGPVGGDLIVEESLIEGGMGGINLKGIGGNLTVMSADQIAEVIAHGALDMSITGSVFLDAGKTDALIRADETMRVHLGDSLFLNSDQGSARLTSLSSLHIHVQNDMILNGISHGTTSIEGEGLSISTGRTCKFYSNTRLKGGTGPLFLIAGGDISFTNPVYQKTPGVYGNQLYIHSRELLSCQGGGTFYASEGALTLKGEEGIHFDGRIQVTAERGDLRVTTCRGNIQMCQSSELIANSGAIDLIAGRSIIFEHFTKLRTSGHRGVTLVVDQLGANPSGGFIMSSTSSIETGQTPLRIFTKSRDFNAIGGKLNKCKVTPTSLYFPTKEQQWGVDFPSRVGGIPFTVFHKDDGYVARNLRQKECVNVLINFIGPFTAELFRILHPYDEYTNGALYFYNRYQTPKAPPSEQTLTSYDLLQKTNYFIKDPKKHKKGWLFM